MRLMSRYFVVWTTAACILFPAGTVWSQQDSGDSPAQESPKSLRKSGRVSFLLGRATDASRNSADEWTAALIEAAMEFKLSVIDSFDLVSPDSVSAHVPAHRSFDRLPTESDYAKAAVRLKADYFGMQKFEISPRDKSVFYYLEVISPEQKKIAFTVEKNFKVNSMGFGIDEVVSALQKEFGIVMPREYARFQRLPSIGQDLKVLKQLGDCIIAERFSKKIDSSKVADEYRRICEKDRSMLLAYYRGGIFFEKIGRYGDAAEALNVLFSSVPEYLPVYPALCRSFRKARRYEDAVRIAMLGEQRGVKGTELLLEKAMSLDLMNRRSEADGVYEKVLAKDPDEPHALLFYARTNNDAGKAAEALGFVDRLAKTGKDPGHADIERGRAFLSQSKNEEAAAAFEKASQYLKDDPVPHVYAGDLYSKLGKYARAVQSYDKALPKRADDIDLHIRASEACAKAGNPKKALSILKQIEPRYSNHGGLQRELGLLEFATGDTAAARRHLEASVRAGQEDGRVLVDLGRIYTASAEYDKAFQVFTRALPMVKDKNVCKVGLAKVYLSKGESGPAIAYLEEVVAADPKIRDVNRYLGDAFLVKKDNAKAIGSYRKERSLHGNDPQLQEQIAQIAFEISPSAEARSEYQELVKLNAGGARAYYRLGILSLRLKDKSSAPGYLAKATKLGEADAETWYQVGRGYASLDFPEKAIEAFATSLSKDPAREAAWVEIASLLERTRQDSAAADAHMKLFALNNDKYKENLAKAGRLYEGRSMKAKAKEAYSTFVAKKYTDHDVNIWLAKIEHADKNYAIVVELFKPVPSARKADPALAMILAESYAAVGQHAQAIPYLETVLKQSPRNATAVELAAVAYEKGGAFEKSAEMYKRFLSLATTDRHQDYAFHLAEMYQKNNFIKIATAQYESNTHSYPRDIRNFDKLAELYTGSKDWSGVIRVLEKATSLEKATEAHHGALARAYLARGDKVAAMVSLKKYLESADKDSSAWFELGKLYFEQKQYGPAASALEKAAILMPRNFDVQKMLGISLYKADECPKAVAPLNRARELRKNDMESIDLLAKCYRLSKDSKNLVQLLQEWTLVDKKNFEIRKELAELYLADSKPADAAVVLEAAADLKSCQVDIHMILASIYEKQGSTERWARNLQSAIQCSPKDGRLYFQMARYNLAQRKDAAGEENLKKAILFSPQHAESRYMYGNFLTEKKRLREAAVHLEQAVRIESANVAYRLAFTEVLFLLGRKQNAFAVIKPAIAENGSNPAVLRWAGLLYKDRGQADSARLILERAVAVDKNCGECLIALGELAFDGADYKEASRNYQRAIDARGYNEKIAVQLARSYAKSGRADQAKNIYETILSNSPQNSEALYQLIHVHIEAKKLDMARTIFQKQTRSRGGWYYLAEAELSEAEGKINQAMGAFSSAVKMMPDNARALAGCGRISLAKQRYAAAVLYFGRAMAADPDDLQLYVDLGKAYEGTREFGSAMDLYEEVARRQPDHPEVHYLMARIISKRQDHLKAIETIREGISKNKRNAMLYLALGHEYRMTRMDDDALKAYLRAVRLDKEKCREGLRHIGNIYYYTKKDAKKARKYYEQYVKNGGQEARVKKELRALQKSSNTKR